jgi:hypothetical protein
MSSEKFQQSKESGAHYLLSKIEGEWEGKTSVWFEPGKLADESPVTASIKPVLDGRFMLMEYKGLFQGNPLNGICIYGHQMSEGKFQSAWIDSFHMGTGIMFSQGEKGNSKQVKVLGSYGAGEGQEPWGWRTELELENDDKLVITAYNISPQGLEAKAVESVFSRKK